jgi:hypothetical protein
MKRKQSMKKIIGNVLAGLMLGLLLSCGGGGSGNGSVDDSIKVGRFLDSPVAGVSYSTETLSGKTNANGEFEYREGETVTLKIGELQLGNPVKAQSRITPFDLVFFPPPDSVFDFFFEIGQMNTGDPDLATPFEVAVNMLILLQTLDYNGDPDDGVEVPDYVAEYFVGAFVAILTQDNDAFFVEFWGLIGAVLADGRSWNTSDGQPKSVDSQQALEHFYRENLGGLPEAF